MSYNVPDDWDDGTQSNVEGGAPVDIQQKLSAVSLNPNASTFVPGKNIFAAAFVPGSLTTTKPAEPVTDKPPLQDAPKEVEPLAKEETVVEVVQESKTSVAAEQWSDDAPVDERRDLELMDEADEGDEEDDVGGQATQIAKVKKIRQDLSNQQKKEHINIVFIGHVDAGKSTTCGRVLQCTGMVDQRTLEKYEREAKEKNRETWYLSWALDTNAEERDKGKTVEVGRAYFETEKRHFTILDAPGHNSFVPNMIGGAAQADVAVLVISARKGEFETGFEKKGQTREHAMLVKTAGVKHLIVLINKMDDPTVEWDESRYNECRDKLLPYLKKCGFNPKTDLTFLPGSGFTGAFIKDPPAAGVCTWYTGPSLLDVLDSLPSIKRINDGPVRIPIVDKYKDMGTIAFGKIESGQVVNGMKLIIMPNKREVEVMGIWSDEIETEIAYTGENVKLKLKNCEEEDLSAGFVICPPENLCKTCSVFDAQVVILEHKSIICAGYSAILHIHTSREEITVKALIATVDKKTGEKAPKPRFIKQDQTAIVRLQVMGGVICLETFKDFPQMGRFTLRDEGKTIAVGKVLKVVA